MNNNYSTFLTDIDKFIKSTLCFINPEESISTIDNSFEYNFNVSADVKYDADCESEGESKDEIDSNSRNISAPAPTTTSTPTPTPSSISAESSEEEINTLIAIPEDKELADPSSYYASKKALSYYHLYKYEYKIQNPHLSWGKIRGDLYHRMLSEEKNN